LWKNQFHDRRFSCAWNSDSGKYLYVEILAHSPFSRMLKAIRDAGLATNVYGKDIVKAGAQTLIIGGAKAAVADALWA